MSAWVVSPAHIDVLVYGLIAHKIITAVEATEVGRELALQRVRDLGEPPL